MSHPGKCLPSYFSLLLNPQFPHLIPFPICPVPPPPPLLFFSLPISTSSIPPKSDNYRHLKSPLPHCLLTDHYSGVEHHINFNCQSPFDALPDTNTDLSTALSTDPQTKDRQGSPLFLARERHIYVY
jgi:hypothetical protein